MENDRTRHATSDALIALRQAMKMTQAQFAVLVLDSAITTVGRYETTHPPQGDLLLRLAKIAEQEAQKERSPAEQEIFIHLKDRFKELYVQDLLEKLECNLLMMPRTDAEQEHAYLVTRVNGERAMTLTLDFLVVAPVLGAKDQNSTLKDALDEATAAMRKAAASIRGNPIASKLPRVFPALMASPAKNKFPTPKTSRKRSKKQ